MYSPFLVQSWCEAVGEIYETPERLRRHPIVLALSDAFAYPAPMAFELKDFTQVQASVFQVTRSPGRYIVYFGCALLILGVFAMLYVRERRLWVWLGAAGDGAHARMALSSNRKLMDVDREFQKLRDRLLGNQT